MSYPAALSLVREGFSAPNDYQVVLPSNVANSLTSDFDDYVSYFCRAVTIPAAANQVLPLMGQENIGINKNVVVGRTFGSPLLMTLTERRDLVVYRTLKGWLDSTVVNSSQQDRVSRNLRTRYYDSIKSDIYIYKMEPITANGVGLSRRDDHSYTGYWRIINAIPLAIEQSTLSVDAVDSLYDINISIQFESFEFVSLEDKLLAGTDRVLSALINGGVATLNNRVLQNFS